MTRPAIHFTVDVVLFVVFLALLGTSGLVQFVFPPGVEGEGRVPWGLGLGQWCTNRFACLAVFAVGLLLHIILQWAWVCSFVAGRIARWRGRRVDLPDGIKTLYGVGALIGVLTLIGFLLAVGAVMIESP